MLRSTNPLHVVTDVPVTDRVILSARMAFPGHSLLAVVLLSLLLGVGLSEGLPAGRSSARPAVRSRSLPREGLSRLPLAAQGPISLALGAAQPAYRITASPGGFRAVNPTQRLHVRFDRSGVLIRAHSMGFGLRLRAVGYGASLQAVGAVAPHVSSGRVVYSRQGLSEWYANGPLGVEQGFTIPRAPAGLPAGPLTLSMAVSGDAHAALASNRQSVTLAHSGGPAFRYGGLAVSDARGRVLHSWLQLNAGRLLLRVDTHGARYPLRIDPFIQLGEKLTGGEESGKGWFGYSVALSSDGSTALIGGFEDNSFVGAAWVFTRSGSTWTQQGGKLTGGEESGGGAFGTSVALSSDGNTALIGGVGDNSSVGAAWVFTRSGSTWTQQGEKLTGSGETGKGQFGSSVALSAEGNYALIGGYGDKEYIGAAWVFLRSGTTWTQQGGKLTGGGSEGEPRFGSSVALSSKGDTALIGGESNGSYKRNGAAWVFTRSGSTWTEQTKLTVPAEREIGYEFGHSVALAADGNTALIGAPLYGPSGGSEPGAVWVFTRGGSTWAQQAKLTGTGGVEAQFGSSVALSSDGYTALVGGHFDGTSATGAAWRFTRAGSTWTQQGTKFTGSGATGGAIHFGASVALSSEADLALVGGSSDHELAGAAWLFAYAFAPNEEELGKENPGKPGQPHCLLGKPVNCATGNETETQTDLTVAGRGPGLNLTRAYNSQLAATQTEPGAFGYGWTGPYSAHLKVDEASKEATVYQDNGSTVTFKENVSKEWVPIGNLVQATLLKEASSYIYTLPDQSKLDFNSAGRLTSETDRNGNTLTVAYDSEHRVESLTDPASRAITFAYNGEGLVESAKDPMGHTVKYAYESKNLASVTEPGESSPRWQFKYNSSHELTSETDGRGHAVSTAYNASNRVISQTDALSRKRTWKYATTESGPRATVTEPNGAVTVEQFNSLGLPASITHAAGTALAATTTYEYDGEGNLTAATDPDEHTIKYGYDASGNRTSETDALGHKTEWSYDSTRDVVSTKNPKGEITTTTRDSHGNPETISRPAPKEATQTTSYKYDSHGELESVTDPLSHTTKYGYDSYGDKTSETDPEGDERTWTYNEDSQGISTISPRGNEAGAEPTKYTTTIERDAQGRPLTVTEPESVREEGSPVDAPSNTTPAAIAGVAQVEQTLSASTGSWTGTPTISYTYQWQSCDALGVSCLDISGATSSTYALGGSDAGNTLRVVVTAMNPAGSASSTSEVTAVVAAAPSSGVDYMSEFGSVGSGEGQFNHPGGVAIDPKGDLWVVDTYNGRLEEFNPEGEYLKSVGSEGSGEGQLAGPTSIAIDSKGDLWVADTANSRVDEFTATGEYVKAVGGPGSLFETEEVGLPEGIAVDAHDNVWVSATYQGRLVVFNNNGEYQKAVGSPGSEPGQIGEPEGVAIDPHGDAWVVDFAYNRVDEFNEKGEYVLRTGSNGSGDGEFSNPYGIAADSHGDLWVVDNLNDRVQELNEKGEYVQQFGTEGSEPGHFSLSYPTGVAVDGSGYLWVTDSTNNRIEKWSSGGAPSNTSAPTISGQAIEGQTLHATVGIWEGTLPLGYTYQWQGCNESGGECHNIEGATSGSYTLSSGNVGTEVRVSVTASNTPGSATATSSATSLVLKATSPSNTSAPAISGTAQQEQTLGATTGTWTGTPSPTYAYQWQRCNSSGASCSNISTATNTTYVIGHGDVGDTLRITVTATNTAGSVSSNSTVTAVIAPLVRTTKYSYDANGNREAVTDPYGHSTSYTYDADNEPITIEEPNGTVAESEYDTHGSVVAQTDGNKHTTKYVRNLLGQVVEVVDPLSRKTTKEYDDAGNLTSLTDPAKRTTTYTYDAGNQVKEVSYSDGKTPTAKYESDADGNRTKMTDGTGETTYTYDQLDRLTESKDGHGDTVGYEYDLANEPTKLTYPNGKAVTRAYDKDGRLKSVTDWFEHTTNFAYNPDSNLTATTFPSGTGEEDTYAYDEHDQMTEVKMGKGSETLASLAYTHDSNGQVTSTVAKGLPGGEEAHYRYDANARLTKAQALSYKYDAANNLIETGSSTNAYDAADELEKGTGVSYSYDELGQRTKMTPTGRSTTSYGYDEAGNLISVERPKEGATLPIEDTYGYNGAGLRASQTVAGATSYLTWDVAEELPLILNDGTNSYIYGASDLPIEQIDGEGHVLYLHHDQQGSTRMITGTSGTVNATMTYDPYGDLTGSTGSVSTALGYDAQDTNWDTGAIYLRARVYDPATGQFMSVDPMSSLTGARYAYANADPLSGSDPTGLWDACHTRAEALERLKALKALVAKENAEERHNLSDGGQRAHVIERCVGGIAVGGVEGWVAKLKVTPVGALANCAAAIYLPAIISHLESLLE